MHYQNHCCIMAQVFSADPEEDFLDGNLMTG